MSEFQANIVRKFSELPGNPDWNTLAAVVDIG